MSPCHFNEIFLFYNSQRHVSFLASHTPRQPSAWAVAGIDHKHNINFTIFMGSQRDHSEWGWQAHIPMCHICEVPLYDLTLRKYWLHIMTTPYLYKSLFEENSYTVIQSIFKYVWTSTMLMGGDDVEGIFLMSWCGQLQEKNSENDQATLNTFGADSIWRWYGSCNPTRYPLCYRLP